MPNVVRKSYAGRVHLQLTADFARPPDQAEPAASDPPEDAGLATQKVCSPFHDEGAYLPVP